MQAIDAHWGLILVGEESTAQVFLGTIICVIWLLLIAFQRPYKAYYDNVLGTMLSANLMMTMICGLCLKMYALERTDDAYEQLVFDYLLSTVAIGSIVIGVLSLVVAIPQLRNCIMSRVMSANKNNLGKHLEENGEFIKWVKLNGFNPKSWNLFSTKRLCRLKMLSCLPHDTKGFFTIWETKSIL